MQVIYLSLQSQHEAKAFHNAQLYNVLDSKKFPDWSVVVLFYQGVHLIESILDTKGEHSETHQDRNKYMNNYTDLFPKELKRDYRELERLSMQARYKPEFGITDENLDTAFQCIETIRYWHGETKKRINTK